MTTHHEGEEPVTGTEQFLLAALGATLDRDVLCLIVVPVRDGRPAVVTLVRDHGEGVDRSVHPGETSAVALRAAIASLGEPEPTIPLTFTPSPDGVTEPAYNPDGSVAT